MHVLNAELLPPPVKEVSARELLPCMKNRGLMHWVESSTRPNGLTVMKLTVDDPEGPQCNLGSQFNYGLFNRNNIGIRSWSWNYRGCWHQTCPPVDTHRWVWVSSITICADRRTARSCCFSSLPHQC